MRIGILYCSDMPLDPDIAMLVTEIDANLSHAESITHGLTGEQFQWRQAAGRWSIGECFVHMNIVNSTALPQIEAGVGQGKTGQGPFRYGFLMRKFIASQELPAKGKFKAPKVFLPPSETDLEQTMAEYRRIQAELKRLTRKANGLHLSRTKIKMPALPAALRAVVRIPLGGQLVLLATHDRRHLWQAEQVRNDPAFPPR
jgi:hypothetical protein